MPGKAGFPGSRQGGGSGKGEPGWPCPGKTRIDTKSAMGLVLGLSGVYFGRKTCQVLETLFFLQSSFVGPAMLWPRFLELCPRFELVNAGGYKPFGELVVQHADIHLQLTARLSVLSLK